MKFEVPIEDKFIQRLKYGYILNNELIEWLKENYKDEYHIRLDRSTINIIFNDDIDLTLFLLRWG
jgi:transcriptional antiterminator